ncbi:MAG: dipeptide epimerase [Polyangiaceae bacterium]|nr:dipeptide epimerase [Polyangiaceae bacterium]
MSSGSTSQRRVRLALERFAVAGVFRTSRDEKREVEVVCCEIEQGSATGRGEGAPLRRYGQSPEGELAAARTVLRALEHGMDRTALGAALGPGPARNAIDCALWDLEAKSTGRPAWQLAGLAPPAPIVTAFTVSLDEPAAMAAAAGAHAELPLLKVKLGREGGREGVCERVRTVRAAAPRARLVVDANEAWTAELYASVAPELAALGVELCEQPLPAADDAALAGLAHPVPVCADESCHDRSSLAALAGRYEAVNVKLDKAGGLTAALALAAAARAAGFELMVGSMVSSSLAIAPALLVAAQARWADLDGALWLARDRPAGMRAQAGRLGPAPSALWG